MKYFIVAILSLFLFRGSVRGTRDLILSELYLKGNADRLEISNIGDEPFSGTITLSGATTPGTVPEYFDIDNLVIISGQAVVIARYGLSSYDYFQNIDVIGAINSKLTLSATGRDIGLWYQDTLLDQLILDYATVQANDTTTSFSKKEKFGFPSVTSPSDVWNVLSGYIASPGTYNIPTDAGQITSTGNRGTGDGEPIASGQQIEIVCIQDANQLRISEIYFGDENHSPFIELQGVSDFQGSVTLSGTILGLSVTIDVNVTKNGFLVISRGDNGLLAGPDRIVESALVLGSSGGDLTLLGQSGQVLDSVQILPLGSQNVFYTDQNGGCQHSLREGGKFSPGFDEKFLFYFSGSKSSQNPTGNSCPICSVCSISSNGAGATITNSSNSPIPEIHSTPSNTGFKITAIDLTTNPSFQTIILQSLLKNPVIFGSSSAFRLHSTNRTTNNVINGTILPGEIKAFTGNRRFPISPNCIELLSGTETLDGHCYGNELRETGSVERGTGNIIIETGTVPRLPLSVMPNTGNTTHSFTPQSYAIKITSIDYDPRGTDAGNEKIGLLLLSGNELDLQNLTLKIGTRNIHLSGMLLRGGEQIFKGTFGFPNSSKNGEDIVISLVRQDYVFDTYIYNPTKIQAGYYSVTSVLDGDTIRIAYNSSARSVRLLGIDAPESNKTRYGKTQCQGNQAKTYLADLIKDKIIYLQLDPTQGSLDSYERILGYVYLDGELINQKMLSQGYAKEYTYNSDYQFRNEFLSAQNSAKANKFGLRNSKLCDQTPLSGQELEIEQGTGSVTWNMSSHLGVKIINILPNPRGNDEGREYLTVIFYRKGKVESGITLSNVINLSDGWYLLINDKKKKLTGQILLNEERILTGKFSLPNKASCIAVGYGDTIFDKLCYDLPQENELIGEGKQILESLTDADLTVLGHVTLRQIDNRLCIVYMGQMITCRNIPPGKTSIRLKNENKLYKNYITLIEGYLQKDWKMLLENTKIGEYLSLFKDAKKALKSGQQKILIGDKQVDIYDLKEQLALKYELPSIQHLQIEIPPVLKRYISFGEEYRACHPERSRRI